MTKRSGILLCTGTNNWQKLSQNSDHNFEDDYENNNRSPQKTAEVGHAVLVHVANHRIRENITESQNGFILKSITNFNTLKK